MRRLASLLDIAPGKVVCVGDSWNDLPMLRAAGRAFAPANALEAVRAEPGVITVGESGVSTLTVGCAGCDLPLYQALGFRLALGNLLAFA